MTSTPRGILLPALVLALAASTASHAATPTQTTRLPTAGAESEQKIGRFIITYRDGSTATASSATARATTALSRAGLSAPGRIATASHLRRLATGAELVKTSRKLDRVEAEAFMRQLAADPAVLRVQPDLLRRPVRDIRAPAAAAPATFTPSDTYYAKYQWHLKAPDGTATQGGNANNGGANVNNAWDLADGNGIVIAVLDTGITRHVDLNTELAGDGYDFITDKLISGRDADGRAPGGWDTGDWTTEEPWLSACTNADNPPEDSTWHGTHVAGTAGAELTNNAAGMAGVAYNAKILPVRVLGHCGGYDSDIADAIIWAAGGSVDGVPANTHPAQVINLSLGGSGVCTASDVTGQAVAQANALGATVVVSAGNSNADAAGYSPASCPGVITVASTGITSRRAYYSNYGTSVEIAAPGGGVYPNDGTSGTPTNDGFVWQALNSGTTTPVDNDSDYGGYAGTSQAAPHVSGVVALVQGARLDAGLPLLTPTEVVDLLQRTAHAPAVAPVANRPIGAGIVDAAAAVKEAIATSCDPQTETCGPQATPLTNKVGVTVSGTAGSETLYSFEAVAGKTLSFITLGGTGNLSLYASFDKAPTSSDFDAKSTRAGNNETVRFTAPKSGTYYLKVVGTGAYAGATLSARQ
ncbi:protease [Pseudoxanthomonas winnipegensis]|jgi:serine protease|uniref:Protease n=1 Tax=Pseudoxanthomonas winnipegensis TaxID=2480810 RepID=A0ABY1WIM8_9GAMM|nr:S8 family peptidase [Pseudoxanthomonas winnipegensis]TAA10049.1 protease [Pseudoxanthomonas winnipegensis]TAA22572.1 protease [Pseudoxanthomonas winnipegensis]TAH72984.1 protease [Pseudoxanthomonas winnipegensis]